MQQLLGPEAWTRERAELGDRAPVTGDGQVLTSGNSIEHLGALVPQLSNRHLCHCEGLYHA